MTLLVFWGDKTFTFWNCSWNGPVGPNRNILNWNQSRTDAMELIESSKSAIPCGWKIPVDGIASWKEVHIHSHHSDEPPSLHKVFLWPSSRGFPHYSQQILSLTFIDGLQAFNVFALTPPIVAWTICTTSDLVKIYGERFKIIFGIWYIYCWRYWQ